MVTLSRYPRASRGFHRTYRRTFTLPTLQADSETVTLPDGRKLGFNVYGAASGPSVLYLHGFPGSRIEGTLFAPAAEHLGVRIISPERPGIGLSSPQPNRTVLDHADDVRHLAKHLGLKQYSVLGVSGGGPYALACAHAHSSERLKGVALVCAVGPWDVGTSGMKLANRALFKAFQYTPSLLRLIVQVSVEAQLRLSDEQLLTVWRRKRNSRFRLVKMPEKDKVLLEKEEFVRMLLPGLRQHFRQGVDAWMEEGRLLISELGFDLRDTKRPLRLWYGRQDVNVPLRVGEEIARRLPNAELRIEDEAHVSLVVNCGERILRDLLCHV